MTTVEALRTGEPGGAPAGPPVGLSSGPLGAVQAADREIGRQTALKVRAVAAFARSRPSSADRQPGEPGCASAASRAARPEILEPVSEWAAQELTVALSISQTAAQLLLEQSLMLVERLPATLDALASGVLGPQHLRPFLERVATISDPAVRATVESRLLSWMTGQVKTPAQLAERARRLVLRHDARGAAQRLAKALRQRGVSTAPGREDGMSALTAVLTTPEAQACLQVLGQYADSIDDDAPANAAGGSAGQRAPRTRAEKMADCLVDLILRPGETDLPVVQAQLTVVASVETLAGGDQPGEIDGQVVPAEVVRQLAHRLGLLPREPHRDDFPTEAVHRDGAAQLTWEAAEPAEPGQADPATDLEWLGAEDAPEEVQRAWWERDAAWAQWVAAAYASDSPVSPDPGVPASAANPTNPADPADPADPASLADPADPTGRSVAPGTWAAADAAIEAASDLVVASIRAVTGARGAVETAERRDALDEAAETAAPAGLLTFARDSLAALTHATTAQRMAIGDLLSRSGGGGLSDRPRIAVVDALSGTLLALTDAAALRREGRCGRSACARRRTACTHDLTDRPGLRPPAATDGYRPAAELDRHVRARDRRCRFPGCRARVPRGGELDHDRRWPDGPTAVTNLTGYCTRHHRGKHQAPGWTHRLCPDGRLTVTTPTGLITTTRPPGYDTTGGRADPAAGLLRSAEPAPF